MPEKSAAFRKHGRPPYSLAVVHGGPGAAGEMLPVAEELAPSIGVLEPFQRQKSVKDQIGELAEALRNEGSPPLVLLGHSWGAWLSALVAAAFPELVRKLILVGTPPLEARYAAEIESTRLERLNEADKTEAELLLAKLGSPADAASLSRGCIARLAALFSKSDQFDPLPDESGAEFHPDVFAEVWPEAALLRSSGKILETFRSLACPITAIHGSYDPHPAGGVRIPLSGAIKDFEFITIERCGHKPWLDKQAKAEFYELLRQHLLP